LKKKQTNGVIALARNGK